MILVRTGRENLCKGSECTGWDADGGFAELLTTQETFAYPIPERFSDTKATLLLCAGIIGHRALKRADVPPGGRLGIYGFGGSAHLTAQLAIAPGAEVHVLTRDAAARQLALELGAASVGPAYGRPPVMLDSAILFAPVGDLVTPSTRWTTPSRALPRAASRAPRRYVYEPDNG